MVHEAHVALKEKMNIIHVPTQRSHAGNSHAESETGKFFPVVNILLPPAEKRGMDHPAAAQLNPSRLLADAAALAPAERAREIHFGARLGERKERRLKTRAHARAKQRFAHVVERAFQIAERNAGIYRQRFQLEE